MGGVDRIFKREKRMHVPHVISGGIMCSSGVIVLNKEILLLLWFVKMWERNVSYCCAANTATPIDPVTDAKDLQYHLDQIKRWQDTLTASVLQLAWVHSGFGILTTGAGAFDADLVVLSAGV